MPFEAAYKRFEHYDKHCVRRGEFPGLSELQYEAHADAFLTARRRLTTIQCRRPQGDIVRFDLVSKEFGVFNRKGFVTTYFVAKPMYHGYHLNTCYFCHECRKVFR